LITDHIILETDTVQLRPLTADDYPHLLSYAINEPQLWKYSLQQAAGEEGLRTYIDYALARKAAGKEYPFIVYSKPAQQYAGSTRFYDINRDYNTLQLGYTWYGSAFHGTGLNKHCKYLLLSYAFEQAGVDRVEFRADADNQRSIAAMQSIGCTVEGILRSHAPRNGLPGRRNTIVLSILKEEWLQGVKQRLLQKL
jgi:N-acetyltransferase